MSSKAPNSDDSMSSQESRTLYHPETEESYIRYGPNTEELNPHRSAEKQAVLHRTNTTTTPTTFQPNVGFAHEATAFTTPLRPLRPLGHIQDRHIQEPTNPTTEPPANDAAFTTPTLARASTPNIALYREAPSNMPCDKCKSTDFTKQCFALDCPKVRCAQCVAQLCRKNSVECLKDEDGDLIHVCTKKCYEKSKAMVGADRLLWTRDGKGGPDDPTHSMSILLKWLTTEGNYNKYRGGPASNGKGKLYWASHISTDIKHAGVRKYRSPKAIKNKISALEDSFKRAHDWAGQTGAGVREGDPRSFREYVLKKCPFYFDLLEVMQDRSTSRPQLTSDSIRLDSDSDLDADVDDNEEEKDNDNQVEDIDIGPRPRSTTPSLSARNARKNDSVSSVIDMQKEAIAETNRNNQQVLAETNRHNLEMEAMRKREFEQAQETAHANNKIAKLTAEQIELANRDAEINYRVSLLDKYERVKDRLDADVIRRMYPEFSAFIQKDNNNNGNN